jgi:Raf kinase inhibitor-like YbhB/YbcL family protein
VSPPLEWHVDGTAEVSEFAIVLADPDAGGFVHWVVARIPGSDTGLDEGAGDPDAGNGLLQGKNGFGSTGYRGPCPPAGTTHHYSFALYAFGAAPDLSDSPTADEVTRAGGSPAVTLDAVYGH